MNYTITNSFNKVLFKDLKPLSYFYLQVMNKVYFKLPKTLKDDKGKEFNAINLSNKAYIYVAEKKSVYHLYEDVRLQPTPFEEVNTPIKPEEKDITNAFEL